MKYTSTFAIVVSLTIVTLITGCGSSNDQTDGTTGTTGAATTGATTGNTTATIEGETGGQEAAQVLKNVSTKDLLNMIAFLQEHPDMSVNEAFIENDKVTDKRVQGATKAQLENEALRRMFVRFGKDDRLFVHVSKTGIKDGFPPPIGKSNMPNPPAVPLTVPEDCLKSCAMIVKKDDTQPFTVVNGIVKLKIQPTQLFAGAHFCSYDDLPAGYPDYSQETEIVSHVGSGFLLDKGGVFVTANHVVKAILGPPDPAKGYDPAKFDRIRIVFSCYKDDTRKMTSELPATSIFRVDKIVFDEANDVALLHLAGTPYKIAPGLKLSPTDPNRQINVQSVGYPRGWSQVVSSVGVLDNFGKNDAGTDLDIYAGQSGSPVLTNDKDHFVVAIVTAVFRADLDYLHAGAGFCIADNGCPVSDGTDCAMNQCMQVKVIRNLLPK